MNGNDETTLERPSRNNLVDALKGICIIFVLITHLPWTDAERVNYLFPYWIDMAVPVFMVISGYVYYYSYIKNGINDIQGAYSPSFFVPKIVRYTIPFCVIFIIEIIISCINGDLSFSFDGFFLTGILFLKGGIGPGSFYYPIMIQFLFVYPVVFFLIKFLKEKGVFICGLLNLIFELTQKAYEMSESYYRLSIARYLLLIAVGCYIAAGEIKNNRLLMSILFIVGAGFIYLYSYGGYKPKILVYWTGTSFLACLLIIPIMVFLLSKASTFRLGILENIGKASYDIFLVQMAWFSFGSGIIDDIIINRMLIFPFNLIICLGLGLLFYHFEAPLTLKLCNNSRRLFSK